MHRKFPLIAAAAIASLGFCTSVRAADEPTTQELLEQIKQLQAKVEQLEKKEQTSSAEVQQTIEQIVQDAERRSTLFLQAGPSGLTALAGYEKNKFFIRSEDGAFSISPVFQFQFRYVAAYADSLIAGGVDTGSEFESGFELRRMKFGAEGTVFDKFEYKFVWFTERDGGEVLLEDAVVFYELNEQWRVFGGQFKDPVAHEELVSSTRQLAADRSLVNELLGGGVTDRVQGVGAQYKSGPLFVTGVYHDGRESINTNFRDTPVNDSDWGAAGRVEYLVFGDIKPYGDFTARNNKSEMFVVGAGADVTGLEDATGFVYAVDAQWENTQGTSVYGAFIGNYTEPYGDGDSTNDYGALAQLAQMITDKTELFGRVGWIDLDGAADDDIWELTIGGNYYVHGHNAKFTADVTYLPDGAPGVSGLGILNSGDEAQVVGRVQFQLVL